MFRSGRILFSSAAALALLGIGPQDPPGATNKVLGRVIGRVLAKTLAGASAQAATDPACYSRLLQSISPSSSRTRMIEELRAYNRRIQTPAARTPLAELPGAFDQALRELAPVSSGFPREEFLRWYAENPVGREAWEKAVRENRSLGEVLHEQVARFEAARPSPRLSQAAEEFEQKLQALRTGCGRDAGCFERGVRKLSETSWKGTCLGKNPIALQGMAANLAIANAGYLQKYAEHGGREPFVWDLFTTNLIWTPILAEVGCRSQLSEKSTIGKPIALEEPLTYRRAFRGFFDGFSKDYWAYMRLSAVIDVSYQAVHLVYEKAQGKEVDLDPKKLALQFGSYLAYDAVYSVPRTMLFSDRLMLRAGPVLRQDLMRAAGTKAGKAIYLLPDVGSRVYITARSADIFKWWEKLAEEKIAGEKTEGPGNSSEPR